MKKIILSLALVSAISLGASAQTVNPKNNAPAHTAVKTKTVNKKLETETPKPSTATGDHKTTMTKPKHKHTNHVVKTKQKTSTK